MDIPKDAHSAHGLRVCFKRAPIRTYMQAACSDVAYLSGVPAGDAGQEVHLVWKSSTELEIWYREAAAAYLYRPTFVWPSLTSRRSYNRYPQSIAPITTRLVHTS